MIKVTLVSKKEKQELLEYESFVFSSGEVSVKFAKNYADKGYIKIVATLDSSDEVMKLFLITDALRRIGYKKIHLIMPYLPYARQDRVMVEGESLSLRVFADLINGQKYNKVYVTDIHNLASLALFNNIVNLEVDHLVYQVLRKNDFKYTIVSPAGAIKKVGQLVKRLHEIDASCVGTLKARKFEVIKCDKERDTSNGEIIGVSVNGDPKDKSCLICDDVIDGGRTFSMIGEELLKRGAKSVDLFVTHGIFSQGLNIPYIDHIYTTDSFRTIEPGTEFFTRNEKWIDKVTQYKLNY